MPDLFIIGDADSSYLVVQSLNDDGDPVVEQLAKFENERARRTFERFFLTERPDDPA